MKRNPAILLILAGLAAGWWLPVGRSDRAPLNDAAEVSSLGEGEERRRDRMKKLLEQLLDEDDFVKHSKLRARSLSALLPLLQEGSFSDSDIARIVDMDPLAAVDHFLNNPVARHEIGEQVAAEWAHRDPVKAIRHLWGKSSYRADDFLVQALTAGYATHPELVGQVIRSKPRRWQELYLETLFKSSYTVQQPGAPPEVESDDPFADDGFWITRKFGEDILHCLADDELREKARTYWEEEPDDEAPAAKSEPETRELDLANYNPEDWGQRDDLREALRDRPEETLAAIVDQGGHHARKAAIRHVLDDFPHVPESWPAALTELEESMDRLGVIPDHPPSKFGTGQFLRGPVVAEWIDRQPLALRRAWAPTFVQTWVTSEPAAALDWACSLPEAAARDEAYQSGLIIWTHRDPPAAIAAVEALPPGELRESAISNAAATWTTIDSTKAKAWVETLPASPGKSRALDRLK